MPKFRDAFESKDDLSNLGSDDRAKALYELILQVLRQRFIMISPSKSTPKRQMEYTGFLFRVPVSDNPHPRPRVYSIRNPATGCYSALILARIHPKRIPYDTVPGFASTTLWLHVRQSPPTATKARRIVCFYSVRPQSAR